METLVFQKSESMGTENIWGLASFELQMNYFLTPQVINFVQV